MSEQYCLHSMTVDDCLPCQKRVFHRQEAHIHRLRQMLINAGAGKDLAEHDAHWFGGNAQPLPPQTVPAQPQTVADQHYTPAVTLSEPVYNDQGFSAGFRLVHPEGVECVFHPVTHTCACGRTDLGVVIDPDATEPTQDRS